MVGLLKPVEVRIAGFGLAAELAIAEHRQRWERCAAFREALLSGLAALDGRVNGDLEHAVPYIVNLSFPGLESDVVIDAWQDLVGISDGAACTSQSYACSHVLSAMQVPSWQSDGALRFSWCASSVEPDWHEMVTALEKAK